MPEPENQSSEIDPAWTMAPIRSQYEVARITGLSRTRIFNLEQSALRKLRWNMELRRLARELGFEVGL